MTSNSSRLPIPLDVIDNILHHLRDDNTTLRICASVSHSFLHLSRSHLCFSVHLSKPSNSQRLSALLTRKPEIALLIRRLFLSDNDLGSASVMWYANDSSLLSILRVVHRLQLLSLNDSYSQWNMLSAEAQSALVTRFRDPNLEVIHISHFLEFPLTMMNNFGNLKKLKLSAVELLDDSISSDGSGSSLDSPPAFTNLRFLHLNLLNSGPMSDETFSRMKNVQHFCFQIHGNPSASLELIQKVIDSSARSLKCISIRAYEPYPGEIYYPMLSLNLGSTNNLELLFVMMKPWMQEEEFDAGLVSLIPFFQHNAATSKLKQLIIAGSLSPFPQSWEVAVALISTCGAWADLDTILCQYSALERVLILVDPHYTPVADELHMKIQFAVHLPLLNERGILEVRTGTIADMRARVWSEY